MKKTLLLSIGLISSTYQKEDLNTNKSIVDINPNPLIKKDFVDTANKVNLSLPPIPNGYTKYKIENVGSIYISNDMELQDGFYAKIVNTQMEKYYHIPTENRIVFQQKGLNEFSKDSYSSYCRIIIETEYGDFSPLTPHLNISVEELRETSKYIEKELRKSMKGTQLKLINYLGTGFININRQSGLKTSYTRQLNNNPPVKVDTYIFQNKDRIHRITLSYRIEEAIQWKDKLQQSIQSLKLTKQ